MIYSKKLKTHIPTTIHKFQYNGQYYINKTRYVIADGKTPVGRVDLSDTPYGVHVNYLENFNPELYGNVGKMADQIEVEHCLNRGLTDFEIVSSADFNSHALHYMRGKRFLPEAYNEVVKNVIETTPKGQPYNTEFLGSVCMYMPKELINKYIEIIKNNPLLKK